MQSGKQRRKNVWTWGVGILLVCVPVSAFALLPIPSRPMQGLVDGAKTLPLGVAKSLERLLLEHQNLTGETVDVLTIEKSPDDEKLIEYANRVFNDWRTTAPKPPSTVVLVFDLEAKKMVVLAGVGLDSVLADRGVSAVESHVAGPELRHKRGDRAVLLSVRKVFELLESPVYVNGKFDDEIRDAGFVETFTPFSETQSGHNWWIWIAAGALLIVFAGYRILAVEVHYTADGWQRSPPWENFVRYLKSKGRKSKLITGGGVSGSY